MQDRNLQEKKQAEEVARLRDRQRTQQRLLAHKHDKQRGTLMKQGRRRNRLLPPQATARIRASGADSVRRSHPALKSSQALLEAAAAIESKEEEVQPPQQPSERNRYLVDSVNFRAQLRDFSNGVSRGTSRGSDLCASVGSGTEGSDVEASTSAPSTPADGRRQSRHGESSIDVFCCVAESKTTNMRSLKI